MNQIHIPVAELKPVMQGFSKVIPKRPTLPVLGCILIESTSSTVTMTGTNLDDYGTWKTDLIGPLPEFRALVPYEAMARIIKGCSADSVLTIIPQKKEVHFVYPVGGINMTDKVATVDLKEWAEMPAPVFTDPISVGEDFKEALLTAFDSASTDSSRYLLQNAFVDVSDKDAQYVVATNGREMYAANSFKLGFDESLIVPNRKFLTWSGFSEDGDWNISMGAPLAKQTVGYVRIESKSWRLITRQVDGTYPNWKNPIPTGDIKTTIKFDEDACKFIKLAAPKLPRYEASDRPVAIEATSGGSVFLHAANEGNAVSLPVTGGCAVGEPVRFSINRDYLLKAVRLGLTELKVYEPDIPVVFQQGGRRLIIAPLRIDTVPTAQPQPQGPAPNPQTNEAPASAEEPQTIPTQEPEMNTTNGMEKANGENKLEASAPAQAFEQVKEQLEKGKEMFKGGIACVNDALKLLAVAQRERRAAEKEIEEVRSTLQSLQKIRI